MAIRIIGTGSASIDLSILFATDFIDCEVLGLQMNYTGLHDLVDRNPKALSADDIIRTLKTKFWPIKAQGLWIPSEGNKLEKKGELSGLNLTMNKMVESQKRGKSGENGKFQDCKSLDLSRITCFRFHKKRKFQANCPLAKKLGTKPGNK